MIDGNLSVEQIVFVLQSLTPSDIADIAIVSFLFYSVTFLFRGTQAVTLFRGMALIVIGLILVSGIFQLQALRWLLVNGLTALVVAVPVIFQPEIRRALERLGRGTVFGTRQAPNAVRLKVIDEICLAAVKLSERRHGALIVLQRNSSLHEYIRTGTPIDSIVTADLMATMFWPKTELHDGAVIIDNNGRIASAASVLPLTASRNLPNPNMGTRHRASVGISEVGDALCVVVSEETGKIAITNSGNMISRLDPERLRLHLNAQYGPSQQEDISLMKRLRDAMQDLTVRVQTRREQQAN